MLCAPEGVRTHPLKRGARSLCSSEGFRGTPRYRIGLRLTAYQNRSRLLTHHYIGIKQYRRRDSFASHSRP
jgi:hypothetical protein